MGLSSEHIRLLGRIAARPRLHEELAFSEGILLYLPLGEGLLDTGLVRERRRHFRPSIMMRLTSRLSDSWDSVLTITPAGRAALHPLRARAELATLRAHQKETTR